MTKPATMRELQDHFGSYFKAQMAVCGYAIERVKWPNTPEDWDWDYIENNFFVTQWTPAYVAWQQLLELRRRNV